MNSYDTLPATKQSPSAAHWYPGCLTSSTHAAAEMDLKISLTTRCGFCMSDDKLSHYHI